VLLFVKFHKHRVLIKQSKNPTIQQSNNPTIQHPNMITKPKLYLSLSIFAFILLFLGIVKRFFAITMFGVTFDIIWIPTTLLVFAMPLLNCVEIIKNTYEINILHWFGLLLNVICMIFLLRHLGIGFEEYSF